MARPQGSLDRGLTNISLGLLRDLRKREDAFFQLGLREEHQQFQLDVSGEAGSAIAWVFEDLTFPFPFSYAPLRRDNDLVYPHFTYGAYLPLEDEDTGEPLDVAEPVDLTAIVTYYVQDPDTDQFRGCRVYVGACSPGAAVAVPFKASMHLSFQGFAAPDEDETDLT